MGEFIRPIKDGNYRHKPQGESVIRVSRLATGGVTEKVGSSRVERIDVIGNPPDSLFGRQSYSTGLHVRAEKVQKGGFLRRPKYRVEIGEVIEQKSPKGKKEKVFRPLSTEVTSAFTKGSARRRGKAELERNPGLLVQRAVIFDAKAHAARPAEPPPSRPEPARKLVGSGAR